MFKNSFYKTYFDKYQDLIVSDVLEAQLEEFKVLAEKVRENDAQIIFAGNGASASISAHGAVDFSKQAKIRAITFDEANLITCLSNDYGYENWISEAIKIYARESDLIVLTSVSGESENTIVAGNTANELGLDVITFSGRDKDNRLRSLGKVNFWVDSHAYNIVECIHMIWITTVIDSIIGTDTYEVS